MTQRTAPPRMSLANLNDGVVLTAQYNPTEIEEELGVNYNDLDVLGMSHKPQQYKNTNNHRVQFTLRFDALTIRDAQGSLGIPTQGANINNARRYLLSLCYAPRGAQDILGGAPPNVLFFWPNLFSLRAKIRRVRIRHFHFASSNAATGRFDADIELHEMRDLRLVSEDVFANGTVRPYAG